MNIFLKRFLQLISITVDLFGKIKNRPKPIKTKELEDQDEIIIIDDIEYILSSGTVYEVKKVKGQIYGIYDNEYIKKSVKFSYTNKENATDILDDLCAGSYEKEFEDEFKNQWIDGIRINSIITDVVHKLDIWE